MLTHRERCIRSITLEEPDRIPLSMNIRQEPYERLMRKLGIENGGGRGYIQVCKNLGIDVINSGLKLEGGYLHDNVELKEGPYGPAYIVGFKDGFEVRKDIWGIDSIWAPDHTYTYTFDKHPLVSI